MAKRTPKSPNTEIPNPPAETGGKVRGGSRTRARRDVASEMAAGQDQAAAASDEFVGVAGNGDEPVQGGSLPSRGPSTDSVSMSSSPSDEDIRMRAYHRYLERGGGHGMDFEDWLAAERDLKSRS